MISRATPFFLGLALFFVPYMAQAAVLSLDPSTSTHGPGETFIVAVRLGNAEDCVNAASVVLTYPIDTLRAVDFSRGDSIISLWVSEPQIDTQKGTVTFAGGIPGGYCGRITGDAGMSNVLGEVVFTVVSASTPKTTITISPASKVYLNDGRGTAASLTVQDSVVTLTTQAGTSSNPWLTQVKGDTTPPQPFTVDVESTNGVFGGRYYVVFSTGDKESGMDHFEILGQYGWKRIQSPYVLPNQSLFGVGDVQVRAIDKAGNIRLGTFVASSTPQRQYSAADFMPFSILVLLLLLAAAIKRYVDHRHKITPTPPLG